MKEELIFIFNSVLLGLGLAMDAFSVSLANGMGEPRMRTRKMCGVAGVFSVFQGLMPMIGWLCVHTMAQKFTEFAPFIPWIALVLLGYIGIKMLAEGIECHRAIKAIEEGNASEAVGKACRQSIGLGALLVQGVATSIDALTVGFTIAEYTWLPALLCALIIAVITFLICFVGIAIGKRFGVALSGKASIFGGVILVLIGIEIFLKGIL